jgi:hypothetical protein
VNDSAGTHYAGFEGAVQGCAGEAIVAEMLGCGAHGRDLRVSRGVVGRNRPVESAANDLAIFVDDDRADRNLSRRECIARFCQRLFHEMFIHARMVNYPAMKPLRSLVLICLAMSVFPVCGLAQGIRIPADFLPLQVGSRWVYELTTDAGTKAGQINFGIEEYTIVGGTSFYVFTEFPFTEEKSDKGEPVRFIRYDRRERQFIRRLGNDEGPLFLDNGASTEVLESDKDGTAQKFLLRTEKMSLTFQRGIGIVEAKLNWPTGVVTAKLVSAASKSMTAAPATTPAPARGAAPPSPPPDRSVVPAPAPVPNRRESPTATLSSNNPRVDVGASVSANGYDIVMIVTNTSDKLLPFRFRSGQSFDFLITDLNGKEVWRWSRDQFFTQVLRTDSIRPNDKWRFDAMWNRIDNEGNKVAPGQYRLFGFITSLPEVRSTPVTMDVR